MKKEFTPEAEGVKAGHELTGILIILVLILAFFWVIGRIASSVGNHSFKNGTYENKTAQKNPQ